MARRVCRLELLDISKEQLFVSNLDKIDMFTKNRNKTRKSNFFLCILRSNDIHACPSEYGSLFCLWWSVVALTTIGYGDMYPNNGGRESIRIGSCLDRYWIDIGVIAVPTACWHRHYQE